MFSAAPHQRSFGRPPCPPAGCAPLPLPPAHRSLETIPHGSPYRSCGYECRTRGHEAGRAPAKTAPVKEEPVKKTVAKAEPAKTVATAAKKAEPAKTETVKVETVKKAEPVKKAPVKKVAPKKVAPKKPVPVETKVNFFVEYAGAQVPVEEVIKNVKATYGKDAKEISIYLKPEESKAYFVADGNAEEMDVFFC